MKDMDGILSRATHVQQRALNVEHPSVFFAGQKVHIWHCEDGPSENTFKRGEATIHYIDGISNTIHFKDELPVGTESGDLIAVEDK